LLKLLGAARPGDIDGACTTVEAAGRAGGVRQPGGPALRTPA